MKKNIKKRQGKILDINKEFANKQIRQEIIETFFCISTKKVDKFKSNDLKYTSLKILFHWFVL